MNEKDLKILIQNVLQEVMKEKMPAQTSSTETNSCKSQAFFDKEVDDISAINLKEQLWVENPVNREAYMEMKKATPARLGLGRSGPRPKTATILRLRADHAAAMDAVFNDVSQEFLDSLNLFTVQTTAENKEEFLAKPDTGKVINEENRKIIAQNCEKNVDVQVIIADGLSSTSIEANIKDFLPSLMQGLKSYGYKTGKPFFIKLGRVGSMDQVTEVLNPTVTVLLIGERPGLVTGESMSCYMTYKGYVNIPEAMRTVVSNIYKQGTPPAEAGAHVASIIKKMIENKASGIDLKL